MEEEKRESNNRGNVILLTVIAIVTMIIVVVGATFAYLASSVQDEAEANINATTNGGSDMLLISSGPNLDLTANTDNFYEGAGDLTSSMDASVLLQTTSRENVTYNYKMYLDIPNNDFEYTSGTCYLKTASTVAEADSYAACKENSATNIWATTDGTNYACYGSSTAVASQIANNSIGCLISASNMWAPETAAELVLDIYKAEGPTCANAGVCVNQLRETVAVSSKNDCEADLNNTWLANITENGMCYSAIETKDLTTVTGRVNLINNVSITANNGTTTDYYKAVVTLINYGHNQIVNGNKTFNGVITIERITE